MIKVSWTIVFIDIDVRGFKKNCELVFVFKIVKSDKSFVLTIISIVSLIVGCTALIKAKRVFGFLFIQWTKLKFQLHTYSSRQSYDTKWLYIISSISAINISAKSELRGSPIIKPSSLNKIFLTNLQKKLILANL